jgi:hypothetical protein
MELHDAHEKRRVVEALDDGIPLPEGDGTDGSEKIEHLHRLTARRAMDVHEEIEAAIPDRGEDVLR